VRNIFLFLLLPATCAAQFYNLDFEGSVNGYLIGWQSYGGSSMPVQADSAVVHSGAWSMKIQNPNPNFSGNIGMVMNQAFPTFLVAGKHLKFTGYMKTSGVTQGYAGLWLDETSPSKGEVLNDSRGNTALGTTDWQPYSIDLDVSPDVTAISFGVNLHGNGTAWFDTLRIQIDGVDFSDAPVPLLAGPSSPQLAWLRQHAVPFESPEPTSAVMPSGRPPSKGLERPAPDFSDLAAFGDMVGNARIVGLGQGTHGTHEFFAMQHRMFEYLVEKKGVTLFCMEAGMAEAALVNNYVQTGKGDPLALVKGIGYWIWNTHEVIDLVEWMRRYNASHATKLQFTGFDMQTGGVSMANVESFVQQAEPAYLSQVQTVYQQATQAQAINLAAVPTAANLATLQNATAAVHAVWQHLNDNTAQYLKSFPAADVAWAVQNAVIVEESTYARIDDRNYRETSMASNLDWILAHEPAGAKAALWAHNLHINKTPGTMGGYLSANHGADYAAVGQLFHSGQITNSYLIPNFPKGAIGPVDTVPSYPATIEYMLHSTGMPRLMLDLRLASANDPASNWITGGMYIRELGAAGGGLYGGGVVYGPNGFGLSYSVGRDFDVIVFHDLSTPSELIQ
jgi:erythromycin esterase